MTAPIIKNISSWSIPDLIELPFKIIVYFLLVDLVDKKTFGMLNLAMMIFSYHALSQIGVLDWLMYELPKKYAKKSNTSKILTESFSFSLINQSIIFLIVVVILALFNDSVFFHIACLAYLFQTLIYNPYIHQTLFLRYKYKFKILRNMRLWLSLIRFTLQVASIKLIGIYGFLLIESLIFILPVIFLFFNTNLKLKPLMSLKKYKYLFLSGMPFFVVILISMVLGNIDRWFIVANFGLEKFAVYSIGIFITTAILIFPGKVLSIFTQYLKELFTKEKNFSINIDKCQSINNVLIGFLVITIFLTDSLLEYLIFIFLPDYIEILNLTNALFLSILLKYGVSLTSNLLYLVDKRKYVAKIQLVTLIFYVGMLYIAFYLEGDILDIIWLTNIILFIQVLIYLVKSISIRSIIFDFESFRFFAIICASIAYYCFREYYFSQWLDFFFGLIVILIFLIKYRKMLDDVNYVSMRKFTTD